MKLDDLRRELGEVDRRIVELVGRRLELASAIGDAKRASGRDTRDFRQERQVIERARATARHLGVPADLAESLTLELIRASLAVQERDRVEARGAGSGQSALVLGGAGKMGGWFARFLASQGFDVEIADPAWAEPSSQPAGFRGRSDWRRGPLDHDLVVVAAPLDRSAEILSGLAERRPPGVVFDVGSLKGPLAAGLRALTEAGVRATSLHPMFGPDTELLSGRHLIFVDVGVPEATARVRRLFDSTMAIQVDMDLESHDRVIAYVLGLSHAVNIAFFDALAASGESVPRLEQVSSTTFEAQLDVAAAVASENPRLYFEIQAGNAFGPEALDTLAASLDRLRRAVARGDETAFVEQMERGRRYLAARRPG